MSEILIPKAIPFAELVADPKLYLMVGRRIAEIVLASFGEDALRTLKPPSVASEVEIRRRTLIVYEWFKIMRGDLKYSIPRVLDTLPQALRCQLAGLPFEPPPVEQGWSPEVEAVPMVRDEVVSQPGDKHE